MEYENDLTLTTQRKFLHWLSSWRSRDNTKFNFFHVDCMILSYFTICPLHGSWKRSNLVIEQLILVSSWHWRTFSHGTTKFCSWLSFMKSLYIYYNFIKYPILTIHFPHHVLSSIRLILQYFTADPTLYSKSEHTSLQGWSSPTQ